MNGLHVDLGFNVDVGASLNVSSGHVDVNLADGGLVSNPSTVRDNGRSPDGQDSVPAVSGRKGSGSDDGRFNLCRRVTFCRCGGNLIGDISKVRSRGLCDDSSLALILLNDRSPLNSASFLVSNRDDLGSSPQPFKKVSIGRSRSSPGSSGRRSDCFCGKESG